FPPIIWNAVELIRYQYRRICHKFRRRQIQQLGAQWSPYELNFDIVQSLNRWDVGVTTSRSNYYHFCSRWELLIDDSPYTNESWCLRIGREPNVLIPNPGIKLVTKVGVFCSPIMQPHVGVKLRRYSAGRARCPSLSLERQHSVYFLASTRQ